MTCIHGKIHLINHFMLLKGNNCFWHNTRVIKLSRFCKQKYCLRRSKLLRWKRGLVTIKTWCCKSAFATPTQIKTLLPFQEDAYILSNIFVSFCAVIAWNGYSKIYEIVLGLLNLRKSEHAPVWYISQQFMYYCILQSTLLVYYFIFILHNVQWINQLTIQIYY